VSLTLIFPDFNYP